MASRGLKSLALGAIIALVLLSAGCSADKPESKGDVPVASGSTGYEVPVNAIVPQPVFEGTADTEIDTSCATRGCVFARCQNAHRLKFQVLCGDMAYNYDMPGDGSAICVPVNMGDGSYRFRIMQNTSANNYVELDSVTLDVDLENEFAPYLLPNVFCSYDGNSACCGLALDLVGDSDASWKALAAVCDWVTENISYDHAKAAELSGKTGYVPNPDETLASRRGICFDYSSLAAAMLRRVGVPAKIVTGYVDDDIYHAWIMVYVDGEWHTAVFNVLEKTWSRCDVTFAATGGGATIGEGSIYIDRYTY